MFKIEYTKKAIKTLRRMSHNTAVLIRDKIEILSSNPYTAANVKKLQGVEGYRLRVGDWRVIYSISDEKLIISVVKIAPRGEAYKE